MAKDSFRRAAEKEMRAQEHKDPSNSVHGLQLWLIGCLTAPVPPCGSHPSQSPLQVSKSGKETQGLFHLKRGEQEEPAFVCTKILIIFRYNTLNILCTTLYQSLRPFIVQRAGTKHMKEKNGAELFASCCRLERGQVGTEIEQVLKRVIQEKQGL